MPHRVDSPGRERARAWRAAWTAVLASVLPVVAVGCAGSGLGDGAPGSASEDARRLNEFQVIGTHNSYKQAMEPELYRRLHQITTRVEGVDYSHLPLTDQLNLGVRALEIDVYHDPEGGRYSHPLGLALLASAGISARPLDPDGELARPGFKVIHDADFDFRSCHLSFEKCLAELREWSEAHPGHWPIIITMNTKQDRGEQPGAVEPGKFDGPVLDALDQAVVAGLGRERLLTPDDVRGSDAGAGRSLEEALREHGWPSVGACRGKFLFVLDEGPEVRDAYVTGHPSLRGRVYFVLAEPGSAEAAFFIINDPIKDQERIRALVREGFMVRTRADADTREARAGSLERFEAAKACGAQVISTDYVIPDRRISETYRVRFEGGGFCRQDPVSSVR